MTRPQCEADTKTDDNARVNPDLYLQRPPTGLLLAPEKSQKRHQQPTRECNAEGNGIVKETRQKQQESEPTKPARATKLTVARRRQSVRQAKRHRYLFHACSGIDASRAA